MMQLPMILRHFLRSVNFNKPF